MGPRTQDPDWLDEDDFEPVDEPADVRHAPDEPSWACLADYEKSRLAYLD